MSAQIDSTACQNVSEFNHSSEVRLEFRSQKISITHSLKRMEYLEDEIYGMNNLIFNDTINKFSKLYIEKENGVVDTISTIPIDHIIIDDSKELFICLSRAIISPYHVLLYNFEGELLFKKMISPLELKLDSSNYLLFKKCHPVFFKYATDNNQVICVDKIYYVELRYWNKLTEKQKEQIRIKKWLKRSRCFPYLFREGFGMKSRYKLTKYQNFYSQTDPFYDFEIFNSKIISIILNSEYNEKVHIMLNPPLSVQ